MPALNFLDIGLAFIEGLALIVSPCILPVLPLVLATSVDGGRRRPYGIIIGFVIAFSAFVLASREVVQVLHINLDIIKYVSLALLLLLGLVMLSEKLSQIFSVATQRLANFGNMLSQDSEGSLMGGIFIGALIGLVWTPCAGPILAAVLVQVIRQQTNVQGILVTLAFAIGAGIPMLFITLTGRIIMDRLSFVAEHAEGVRKAFGVILILSAAFLAFGTQADALFAAGGPGTTAADSGRLENGVRNPYPAPEFAASDTWLNSPPLTMQSLRGRVVLVDFWTYSCINCVRTLPYLTAWDAKYREQGLVIVGVHSPEFEFEKNVGNIKTAIAKYGIKYPVAVDSNLDTWTAFNNQYWPAHYLIDQNGKVVYTHFGEGHYDVTENNIRYLLGLGSDGTQPQHASLQLPVFSQTPETYLGAARGARYAGTPKLEEGTQDFSAPSFVPESHWALSGNWKIEAEKITALAAGDKLVFNVKSKKVYLVMGAADGAPHDVALKLNGAALGADAGADAMGDTVTVNGHALYELVNQKAFANSLLEITAQTPGVEMYAFTFGD